MSKDEIIIAPGDFQLDAKELTKNVPMLMRGAAKSAVEALNQLDLNHNGKSDIAELIVLGAHATPILAKLNDAIDFEVLAEEISKSPAVKDQAVLKAALIELGHLAEQAGRMVPVQK